MSHIFYPTETINLNDFLCVCLRIMMSNVLSYQMSLRYESRIVMFATISEWNRCPVRIYLQLFVGGLMHVLFTLFVFVCVQWRPTHIVLCFIFVCLVSCVPNVVFGLSIILDCPFVFSNVYLVQMLKRLLTERTVYI